MNIPGFTAEASLYNGKVCYQTATKAGCYGGIVQPALTLIDVIRADPREFSYCWELRCFEESHVGRICLWVNRCLGE